MMQHSALPPQASTTDLLAVIALAAFFCGATGFYVFPGVQWFTVFGLLGFPILSFLLGYRENAVNPLHLAACALLVAVNSGLTGHPLPPLPVLCTLAVWLAALQVLNRFPIVWQEGGILWVALLTLYIPTMFLMEYGSLSMMFLCLGRFSRLHQQQHADTVPLPPMPLPQRLTWLFTVLFSACMLSVHFNFSAISVCSLIILYMLMAVGLTQFREGPLFTSGGTAPPPAHGGNALMALLAKHWLAVLTVQTLLFQWVGKIQDPQRFNQGFGLVF